METIEVVSRGRRARRLAPACHRLLKRLLEATGRGGAGVTLLLAGDVTVRSLNRRFRGVDRVTDVLAFPAGNDDGRRETYLGDIAMSVPRAARQARHARWGFQSEVALLITHGYLHLLGYDHETDGGTMRRLEEDLLKQVAGVHLTRRAAPWGRTPAEARRRPDRRQTR